MIWFASRLEAVDCVEAHVGMTMPTMQHGLRSMASALSEYDTVGQHGRRQIAYGGKRG